MARGILCLRLTTLTSTCSCEMGSRCYGLQECVAFRFAQEDKDKEEAAVVADKSMSLFVRVTPGEHHRLTAAAKEEGISMAELTRRALLAVMVRPCRPHNVVPPH